MDAVRWTFCYINSTRCSTLFGSAYHCKRFYEELPHHWLFAVTTASRFRRGGSLRFKSSSTRTTGSERKTCVPSGSWSSKWKLMLPTSGHPSLKNRRCRKQPHPRRSTTVHSPRLNRTSLPPNWTISRRTSLKVSSSPPKSSRPSNGRSII